MILLALLLFAGGILFLIVGFVEAQWQVVQSPESVVKKVATDFGEIFYSITVQRHWVRNIAGIALAVLYLFATLSAIAVLWSALNGRVLQHSNISACWIISASLVVAIPLQWKFASETKMIEAYDHTAAVGKAVLTVAGASTHFDLYPFLIIGIALTLSIVLRQSIEMKADLEGTI
ncbi:MAG: hypothetical protein WA793_07645 [Sphingorhabdus sp.]|uniref:hypothetical protein n=1 Tax=Sphingorhabdus sp. TaxID=1902408 RepID=UPI003C9B06A6